MSRYFAAFDLAVAAAGYNAFHELIDVRASRPCSCRCRATPTIRPPGPAGRRTRGSRSPSTAPATRRSRSGSRELADPVRAAELARRLRPRVPRQRRRRRGRPRRPRCSPASARRPTVRDRGRFNRWLRLSSHRVGPSLPLVAALGARDLVRHPERRSPYLGGPRARRPRRRSSRRGSARRSGSCRPSGSSSSPTRPAFGDLRAARGRIRAAAALAASPAASPAVGPDDLRARVRLLLGGPQAAAGGLDRRARRGSARPRGRSRARRWRADREPACGTLGDAYGGSGPD